MNNVLVNQDSLNNIGKPDPTLESKTSTNATRVIDHSTAIPSVNIPVAADMPVVVTQKINDQDTSTVNVNKVAKKKPAKKPFCIYMDLFEFVLSNVGKLPPMGQQKLLLKRYYSICNYHLPSARLSTIHIDKLEQNTSFFTGSVLFNNEGHKVFKNQALAIMYNVIQAGKTRHKVLILIDIPILGTMNLSDYGRSFLSTGTNYGEVTIAVEYKRSLYRRILYNHSVKSQLGVLDHRAVIEIAVKEGVSKLYDVLLK